MPVDTRTLLPVLGCVVAALLVAVLPQWLDLFTLLSLTIYLVMALLALSLAFIWGFGGILCFGQAAFFGLGAYAYAIGVLNIGDSTWPVLLAIAVPALVAAAMGYFMFYGGISDVYLGDYAGGHADSVQRDELHLGLRIPHRQRTARRFQRHSGDSHPQHAVQP